MKQYLFALGTNHSLCKIDIVNTLLKQGVNFEILEASEEALIISSITELAAEKLINQLGSAAKIGEIIKTATGDGLGAEIKSIVKNKKFGISVYGAGGKLREVDRVYREIRKIGGIKGNERILSTVAVDKKGLLKNGIEFVVGVGSNNIYLGKTLAIQDYENYSLRDYGRPNRDARSGMIPPKLAKIMINLASITKTDLVLDPFCGSGTILQEMALLGCQNIIGSDMEERAVVDSQKNLDWLFKNYPLDKSDYKIRIFKSDARTLSSKIAYKSVDAVISEPYLGSPAISRYSQDQIRKEILKLEELFLAFFKELTKILKNQGAIVIIFPVFRFKDQFYKLQILDKLRELGFEPTTFLNGKIKGEELLNLNLTERTSIVYFRPGQSVSREIFILTKNIT